MIKISKGLNKESQMYNCTICSSLGDLETDIYLGVDPERGAFLNFMRGGSGSYSKLDDRRQ